MPRQILPGKDFIQWVPDPKTPKAKRKMYVFPELVIGDEIPDDRWNDWEWLQQLEDRNLYHKRLMRGTLDQVLYNSLIVLMNNNWDSITPANRAQFEDALLDLIMPKEDIMLTFGVECIIRRVAASLPHGHYVWK